MKRPGRGGLRAAWVPLVQLAWTLALVPSVLRWQAVDFPDELLEFFAPWADFWVRAIARGQFWTWNPWKLNGASIFAEMPAVAPAHPLTVLLPSLGTERWLLLVMLVHPALSGWGVHVLARRLGANTLGAWAAGLLWGASTPVLSAVVDAQIDTLPPQTALPWAFVVGVRLVEAAREGRGLRREVGLLALLLGWPALCGHTRVAALGFAAVALWVLALQVRGPRAPWGRWLLGITGAMGLGALLASPAVLPLLSELRLTRSGPPAGAEELVGQALRPGGLLQLLYPRALLIDERAYRVGAAVLLLVLGARRDRRQQAALGTVLLLLLAGMGNAGPLGPVLRPLSWLLYPTETMAAATAVPMLCALAGLGLGRASELRGRPGFGWAILVLGLGCGLTWAGWAEAVSLYAPQVLRIRTLEAEGLRHGLVASAALAAALGVIAWRPGKAATVLLLAVVAGDGWWFAHRVDGAIPSPVARPAWTSRLPVVLREPPTQDGLRVLVWPLPPPRDFRGSLGGAWQDPGHGWGRDRLHDPVQGIVSEARAFTGWPVLPGSGVGTGIELAGGRTKVPAMPYSVLAAWLAQGLPGPGQLLEPPPPRGLLPEHMPALWARLLEVLHVGVVVGADGPDWPGLSPVPVTADRRRAPVTDPRPVALLSREVLWVPDPAEVARRVLGVGHDLRRQAIVLASPEGAPALPGGAALPGTVVARSPGRWRVSLPPGHGGGVLTIAERWHPGWAAKDGQGVALRVLSANLVQCAVVVPNGVDEVELAFEAPGLRLGLTLGGAGLLAVLGLLWGARSRPQGGTGMG